MVHTDPARYFRSGHRSTRWPSRSSASQVAVVAPDVRLLPQDGSNWVWLCGRPATADQRCCPVGADRQRYRRIATGRGAGGCADQHPHRRLRGSAQRPRRRQVALGVRHNRILRHTLAAPPRQLPEVPARAGSAAAPRRRRPLPARPHATAPCDRRSVPDRAAAAAVC
jgi:hypothetical protein